MGTLWAAAGDLLLGVLNFFQTITGSYGLAIILLTVVVRLLMYPLSHKQMVSMTQMQKIQPRLKVIQEKYANDKERLQKEMMLLYKEHNVNPLSGCLPLIVQLPIMILLFRVLMNYNVANTSFLGLPLEKSVQIALAEAVSVPLVDGKVGFFAVLNGVVANPAGLVHVELYLASLLLIVFICFLTWFQQKISGAANNPQMATMNTVMPIMMGFICLSLPGGVLLYWGTSSLIGIAQQWIVMKRTKIEIASNKPVLHKNKPVSGVSAKPVATQVQEDDYDDDEYDDEEYEDDEYEDDYEDDEEENKEGGKK